jgi:hypothetical protein
MKKFSLTSIALCVLTALPLHVQADERESLEVLRATTLNLIQALVQQGVLTQDKADEIVRKATASAAARPAPSEPAPAADAGAQNAKSVRVPYVPEFVRREMRDQIKEEVLAQAKAERWAAPALLPDWLDRFTFSGELTVRFQDDVFRSCGADTADTSTCNVPQPVYVNNTPGSTIANTTNNRQRLRLRAIEGAEVKVNDHVDAEIRLSTGALADPVTNNQTLGNNFSRPTIGLDRGYVHWHPQSWLDVQGGRFANPFFGTDLLWYDRLNLDGVAVKLQRKVRDAGALFLTGGAFPLQEIEPIYGTAIKSKWMYGAQLGGQAESTDHSSARVAVGYYNFTHTEGIANDGSGTNDLNGKSVPTYQQKGNTLFNINYNSPLSATTGQPILSPAYGLASRFRVLDLTARFDLASYDPVHAVLLVDVARNVGFDVNEILARTGGQAFDPKYPSDPLHARTRAYGTRLTVGYPRLKAYGEWQAYAGYKYLERDAVLDAFTDPDFHLGGTDAKGWLAGAALGIDKNTWVSLKYLSTQAIDGLPLSIDTFQADFNVRF